MKWRVGLKISLGYSLALAALIIIGIISFTTIQSLMVNVALVEKTNNEISLLNNLVTQIEDAESAERGYVISGEESYLVTYNQDIVKIPQDIRELQNLMAQNPMLTANMEKLEALVKEKLSTLETVVKLKRGDTPEEAAKTIIAGFGKEQMDQIKSHVIDLSDMLSSLMKERQILMNKSTRNLNQIILIGIPLAVVLVCLVAFLIVIDIINPLRRTTLLANQIAEGDLLLKPEMEKRQDEIGDLLRSFSAMIGTYSSMAELTREISRGDLSVSIIPKSEKDIMGNALSDMVDSLRKVAETSRAIAGGNLTVVIEPKSNKDVMGITMKAMVASLREITGEIIEGVNIIASASSEIMASTAQVSSAAMETAAAINETTSSVEEVKQGAAMASEKARKVSETTRVTVQISEEGIHSVEQSIEGMGRIQNQVESIAQSLVRLSEQSQAIGEIITSVNDLAEQSNLLAVNAAIEAAKAGEQGKGFAVVAQEMKILAEQSKEATRQVRTILSDILKAINSAVIATEQGGKAVGTGASQSRDTGETIKKMAEGIDRAAQMALQIEITSQQQLAGMDQIAFAMENVRQAGEQNVSGTKQVEYTVQNLHELGQRLKHTVEKYKM